MHALRFEPSGGWLASHSCEAGLSQGHSHIARYNTTTYQQLPTSQREALHHAAQPLSTGWVRTQGGGGSEGQRVGRIPSRVQTERCSQQHYHPIPHLQACS
jgi:hypothetical protein